MCIGISVTTGLTFALAVLSDIMFIGSIDIIELESTDTIERSALILFHLVRSANRRIIARVELVIRLTDLAPVAAGCRLCERA